MNSDPPRNLPPHAQNPVPVVRVLESALAVGSAERAGARIGPYKLLQEIGEGGFGVVWMAEQQEPIHRRVALKIIKSGMDTREVIARFEAERQALALMEHPNIARVLDAGATDSGRPFFVMELVRGIPITHYCDENRLATEARLKLFVTVCRAVQHAHQKGVIHRDLKPSNILVTLHDGVPVPKIIDFGIAKATGGARLTEKTLFTQFHAFVGTPAYTSPEQMEMSGLDVDTRSDIYSLGVLLYELLAGRPPFDADVLAKSGLEAMRRTIREVDPPRPSQRLDTLTEAERTTVARQRATDVIKLVARLHGDLDCIIMRCLEKDRTRRYDTANGVASDIERHLGNEPIIARPPSWLYHARKFVGRHKFGVAAAGAFALALLAGLIASSLLLVRERSAHARAVVSERAEADLRRQAEESRTAEAKRSSQASALLAERLLAEGRASDAIARLVHAARSDPGNRLIAPRLVSLLASRNFLLPSGPPLHLDSQVCHSSFSPDGERVFVLCTDGTLAILDAANNVVARGRLPAPPSSRGDVAVHGDLVAVACQDGVIRVINRSTSAVAREIRFGVRVQMARAGLHGGSSMLAWLENQALGVADISTGRAVVFETKVAAAWIGDITLDGRWCLVSVEPFLELQIWNSDTGKKSGTLAFEASRGFWSAPFWQVSPDGRRLATLHASDRDRSGPVTLQIRSFPDLTPVTEPQTVENMISVPGNSLAISPNSRWLLVSSQQGRQVYDLTTGAKVGAYVEGGSEGVFFPDGRRFLTDVAGGIRCFATETGQPTSPVMLHEGIVLSGELSDGGRVLLTTSTDGFARLWDTATARLVAEPALQQSVEPHASVSSDGTQVLIGTSAGVVYRLRVGRGAVRSLALPRLAPAMPAPFLPGTPARLLSLRDDRAVVIDVATGREVDGGFKYPEPVQGLDVGQRGVAIRADLRYMVVLTQAGQWQAWELAHSRVARVVALEDAPGGIGWIRFSPAGDWIAIIPNDDLRLVRFWDLRTGKSVGRPILHDAIIVTQNWIPGAFSPDGRRFAAGTVNGVVKVWDVVTGEETLHLTSLHDAVVRFADYSIDGSRIVAANAGGEARLWDAATGQPASPVLQHGAEITRVEFSADGRYLLTASADRTCRLWDAHDGSPVGNGISARGGIRFAQFNTDATRVATATSGVTARVWDAFSGRPITDDLEHPVRLYSAIFSSDGRFLRTETVGTPSARTTHWLWPIPPPLPAGANTPEWLLELATICATKTLDADGRIVDASDALAQIDRVRHELAALPPNAPYVEWGRWVLDDRADRPIAPSFTITPSEADRLEKELRAGTAFGTVETPP